MTSTLFNAVNPHALESIVELAEQRTVLASEDIYDDRGLKLWAKGKPVSRELQEKLLRRRLKQPLETSLEAEHALGFDDIVNSARQVIEANPLIGRIAGREAIGLLSSLRRFPIPPPLRLLLTSSQVKNTPTYRHTLLCVLVSAGLAARGGLSEHDSQLLVVAALLHDIGEIYVNPAYLTTGRRLAPNEWKHVASHPHISRMLLEDMTTLPTSVAQMVGQHHERLDGSGYPDQAAVQRQHRLSSWLAVADTASAILARGDTGAPLRVALALRMVPEEYDRQAVNAMLQALKHGGDVYGERGDPHCIEHAHAAWEQTNLAAGAAVLASKVSQHLFVRELAQAAMNVLGNLDKALRATGVIDAGSLEALGDDPELLAEVCLVVREARWRMRNLARNIHLRAEAHADGLCLDELAPLIVALDAEALQPTDAPAG